MSKPLFIQIHTLTSYPGTLLNRDDVGFAKRLPFGGVTRTRVSSQCLKRHWRTFGGEHALSSLKDGADPVELSTRSRRTFQQFVVEPLVDEGVSRELALAATEAVMVEVLGESAKAKKAKADAKDKKKEGEENEELPLLATGQITVLGKPELDFFLAEARAIAEAAGSPEDVAKEAKKRFTKEWSKNLNGLRQAAGLDAALFGRMVTSDKLARADAAVHVAHAFTVHAEQAETDYFAAVDDLLQGGDDPQLGSGHIGTTELTSGLFYSYVVVDVAQLVSNLEGCDPKAWTSADRTLAADVVSSLVQLVSRVSPGAKKGSTAPYAYSHLTLVEAGAAQPRTLANAFFEPVKDQPLLEKTYKTLATYLTEVDEAFGGKPRRALMAIGAKDALTQIDIEKVSLDDVARFAADAIREPR